MKLFGSYTSPFVRACRIALIETKIDCEFIETDAASSAQLSPTKKVPFLQDGDIALTDSSSIVKYIREQAGEPFLNTITHYDNFLLINTALDTCVNLFLLEKDSITPEQSPYLQRQAARIASTLGELNKLTLSTTAPYNDVELRLACYLGWGEYRDRFSIEEFKHLKAFMAGISTYVPFTCTAPPAAN